MSKKNVFYQLIQTIDDWREGEKYTTVLRTFESKEEAEKVKKAKKKEAEKPGAYQGGYFPTFEIVEV